MWPLSWPPRLAVCPRPAEQAHALKITLPRRDLAFPRIGPRRPRSQRRARRNLDPVRVLAELVQLHVERHLADRGAAIVLAIGASQRVLEEVLVQHLDHRAWTHVGRVSPNSRAVTP